MGMGLTPRMRECLDFIRAYFRENGQMPTLAELAYALGLSRNKSRAHYLITSLIERGYLRRAKYLGTDTTRERGLEIVETEHNHGTDCLCAACPARRLQYQQFVEALQSTPEMRSTARFTNIKPLTHETRLHWRTGFPRSLKRSQVA